MMAVSAGVAAAATTGQTACQEHGVENAVCLPSGAGWAALCWWSVEGMGALGDVLTQFSKREYLIFVHFYKLVSVCTLAFLYSAHDHCSGPVPPSPSPISSPFPPPTPISSSMFPSHPVPSLACCQPGLCLSGHAGDAGIDPAAWGLRGLSLGVRLAGLNHGAGHRAGIPLDA